MVGCEAIVSVGTTVKYMDFVATPAWWDQQLG
jgi:hypothetical protein